MVAGCGADSKLLGKVAEVYDWLDAQILENEKLIGRCEACGKCCDFVSFDHLLFVTSPELIYFRAKVAPGNIRLIRGGCCPYLANGRCGVYKYRFAGCRIFCCNGDADFQSELSESTVKMFKAICEEFQIPYRYIDLLTAIKSLTNI